MKLTDGEKLILMMLGDLHKNLNVRGEIDGEFVQASILNDQLWGLRWQYGFVFQDHEDDPADVTETADILQMFTWIDRSFNSLSATDQAKVKQQTSANAHYLTFEGFDGNNDAHFHIASYMVDDLGRFDEYAGKDLNSHSIASLPKYRRMLPIYKRTLRGSTLMTADQLIAVLNA